MPFTKSLSAALCLLLLTLPLQAEAPNVANLDRSPDPESRQYKIMPPEEVDGKTYNEWIRVLKHHDPYQRIQALLSMLAFGDKAADAVPEVNKMVRGDRDAGVKIKALFFIKNVTKINDDDMEKTVRTLGQSIHNDNHSIVRYEAVTAIPRFGAKIREHPKAREEVVSALVYLLRNDTTTCEMRKACITALIVVGGDPTTGPEDKVINALILRTKPLYEPSNVVRLEAIIALGVLGKPQDPRKLKMVLGALHDHYRSNDKSIRIWTRVSLMFLEGKLEEEKTNKQEKEKINKEINKIVAFLKGTTRDPDREVRRHAVNALGALGKRADEHVKDICDLLEAEEETMVQKAACTALTNMGDKSPRVINALIRLTKLNKRKNVEAVLAACAALAYFHVASPEVLAAMETVLKYDSLDDREKELVKGYIKALKTPLKDAPKKKPAAGKK